MSFYGSVWINMTLLQRKKKYECKTDTKQSMSKGAERRDLKVQFKKVIASSCDTIVSTPYETNQEFTQFWILWYFFWALLASVLQSLL